MSLVAGVRWSFRGKDAGSLRMRSHTGATEDAASGRAARPGGTAVISPSPPWPYAGAKVTVTKASIACLPGSIGVDAASSRAIAA